MSTQDLQIMAVLVDCTYGMSLHRLITEAIFADDDAAQALLFDLA